MRDNRPRGEKKSDQNKGTPVFSVHDEIRRNRRIALNKRIRRAQKTQRSVLAIALSLFVVLFTLFAVVFVVTRTRDVTVSGNSRYSAEEIISAADIDGDTLLLLSDKSIYKKIVLACPYINGVELKKNYPSSVEIAVTEAEVVYYSDIHGRTYSLDRDLRVIEFTKKTDGLVFLVFPEVVSVLEGSKIAFAEERYEELVPRIIGELLGDGELPFTSLDLSNRFSISGMAGDSTKIEFGDYNDLNLKLKTAVKLLQMAQEEQSKRTLINVSSLASPPPSFIPHYTGEF